MKKSEAISRNFRIFGARYVILDFFYQLFRFLHKQTVGENPNEKEKIIVKKINDYYMFIDKNGKGIHRDLYLHSTREPVSTTIVNSILQEGDIVLDAGANIGYYVIMESKRVGGKGIVYAVEPIKISFDLLKKNVKLNKLKNVKFYNLAFNDKQGEIDINISLESNLNTPIKTKEATKIEKVKATTLDLFFRDKKKPTFMRMDIEGFEHVVFRGGLKTLNSLEKIFVELHFPLIDKKSMVSLLKLLKKKGFEIDKAVLERWVEEESLLGKIVNYLHKRRSRPVIFENMTIDSLMKAKDFMDGHHSLEVFFVKK